ncbi:ankyrin repeat-containing protein [Heterostelium album PN500]|uniref:non-specific serine/threonine protein kinase n=1 Tax=Heterostelium pallidum (strain ATCC 26659 / Pp 5 / PN500) TaxID=670386 RepID=D3B860_HETP5|nr:ankyrin repeat-containing protein [Heterostelium album PN500]EFA82228.1 ankyrin repeat-containing protein [Heterostelium album PN500]|eukprot:XP_020434345.1 ankyrin repeat-containing protein [Heterostelium album PN500]
MSDHDLLYAVEQKDIAKESPLHYAVRLGRDDLVAVLLKAGADVSIVGAHKNEKKTPHELAVSEGHKEMAARIKKYEDLFAWLVENGIEQYKMAFVQEEMFIDVLGDMNESILDKMKITAAGHRLKILKATALLKEQHPDTPPPSTPTTSTTTTLSHTHLFDDDPDFANDNTDYSGLRDSLHQLKHITDINIISDGEIEYTEKLGAGSSGKVYKGLYKGKEVAIKVLKSMTEDKEIQEFKKEFQIMSAIRSKHVVHFYGAVLEPKPCMVMENCSNGSLYHVMNNEKLDIRWEKTFRFALETARGLDCLHSWNPQIVHRDLKSLNLLVNDKWEIKVCDFGLSRFNTGSNMETLAKMRGTMAYCAPEIYFGEQFSIKSDVYSIGMILWELVTRCVHGRYERPFSEYTNLQHDFQIIIQTSKKALRPTIPAECPPKFAQLIRECWDAAFEKRPNCGEIIKRLESLEAEFLANQDQWNKCINPLPANND